MPNSAAGNVLIIVVGQQGLDVRGEIRYISELRQSTVLYDPSAKDVYEACRASYQVVYFGCHSEDGNIHLASDEVMTRNDIAQVARMCHAECVFFSSCSTQEIAAYLVAHGTKYCIRTNVELTDKDAWKMVISFFRALYNGAHGSIVLAFREADTSEGKYGLDVSPQMLIELIIETSRLNQRLGHGQVIMSTKAVVVSLVTYTLILSLISLLMYLLLGGTIR